jgi:hypothetical protein
MPPRDRAREADRGADGDHSREAGRTTGGDRDPGERSPGKTISEAAFAARLRSLGVEEFARFVADLWSGRGWDARVDDGVVVATDPASDRRLALAVRPSRRWRRWLSSAAGSPPGSSADADAIVTAASDADASGSDVRVFDAGDLRGMALFALDAEARDDLFVRHFGGTLAELGDRRLDRRSGAGTAETGSAETTDAGRRRSALRSASVAVAIVLVAGLVLVPAFPALLDGDPAGESFGTATDRPTATDRSPAASRRTAAPPGDATSTPGASAERARAIAVEGPLPPGVTADGIADAGALADAHERAIRDRSYRWFLLHRQYDRGDAIGVASELVRVQKSDIYVSEVTHSGEFRTYPFPVANRETYADGTREYTHPVEMPVERPWNPWPDGFDGPADRAAALVRGLLSTTDSRIVNASRIDGRRYYRLTGEGTDYVRVANYSTVAVVDETGLVRYARASYDLANVDGVSVVVVFNYDFWNETVVPPGWYGERTRSTPDGRAREDEAGTTGSPAETAATSRQSAMIPGRSAMIPGRSAMTPRRSTAPVRGDSRIDPRRAPRSAS